MNKVEIGISDDYAYLDIWEGYEFYYGYEEIEVVNGEEEWCFVCTFEGNKMFKTPYSKLMRACPERSLSEGDVAELLLIGIGLVTRTMITHMTEQKCTL